MMRNQQGFTYLAVLFAVALLGIGLAATGTLWSITSQREKEQALLEVGHAYRDAIRQYCEQSPGTVKRYPTHLDDLLLDRRYLPIRRYLRKQYADPITGADNWGLVVASDGGIMGVFSRSERAPLQRQGFARADQALEGARRYADWKFVYAPPALPSSAKQP